MKQNNWSKGPIGADKYTSALSTQLQVNPAAERKKKQEKTKHQITVTVWEQVKMRCESERERETNENKEYKHFDKN